MLDHGAFSRTNLTRSAWSPKGQYRTPPSRQFSPFALRGSARMFWDSGCAPAVQAYGVAVATFFAVCEPADFAEWGGDVSGPVGAVWEEFVDEIERCRCERWDGRWLFTRDCSRFHVYGGVSRMTRAELDQLVAGGFLREVSADEFESAWVAAEASGTELADGHEDKPSLIGRAGG